MESVRFAFLYSSMQNHKLQESTHFSSVSYSESMTLHRYYTAHPRQAPVFLGLCHFTKSFSNDILFYKNKEERERTYG